MTRPQVPEVVFPAAWSTKQIAEWIAATWQRQLFEVEPRVCFHLPSAWRDELEPRSWNEAVGHWPTFSIESHWGCGASATGELLVMFIHRRAS